MVEIPDRVFPELLYARFALAIIQRAYTAVSENLFRAIPIHTVVLEIRAERLAARQEKGKEKGKLKLFVCKR